MTTMAVDTVTEAAGATRPILPGKEHAPMRLFQRALGRLRTSSLNPTRRSASAATADRLGAIERSLESVTAALAESNRHNVAVLEAIRALDGAGAMRHGDMWDNIETRHRDMWDNAQQRHVDLIGTITTGQRSVLDAVATRHDDLWAQVTSLGATLAAIAAGLDGLDRQSRQLHSDAWNAAGHRTDVITKTIDEFISTTSERLDDMMAAISEAKLDAWRAAEQRHQELKASLEKAADDR